MSLFSLLIFLSSSLLISSLLLSSPRLCCCCDVAVCVAWLVGVVVWLVGVVVCCRCVSLWLWLKSWLWRLWCENPRVHPKRLRVYVQNVHTEAFWMDTRRRGGVIASSANQNLPTRAPGSKKKPLDLTHFKARSRFLQSFALHC